MASAAIFRLTPKQLQAAIDRHLQRYADWIGTLVLSVPFWLLYAFASAGQYLSDANAYRQARVLLAYGLPRFGPADSPLPDISFLLGYWFPGLGVLPVLGGLACGALLWWFWKRIPLSIPPLTRAALLLMLVSLPSFLYVGSQSPQDSLFLLLLVLGGYQWLDFVEEDFTVTGFIAGLILSLAYYVRPNLSVLLVLLIALLTWRYWTKDKKGVQRAGWLSSVIVMLFPLVTVMGTWLYLHVQFRGMIRYDVGAAGEYLRWQGSQPQSVPELLAQIANQLLQLPLYGAVFVLLLRHERQRLRFLLLPLALVVLAGLLGVPLSPWLALSMYLVVALMSLPKQLPRWGNALLLLAVLLQVGVGMAGALRSDTLRQWGYSLLTGAPSPQTQLELSLRDALAEQPPQNVLIYEHSAYRLLARQGTLDPFFLSFRETYPLALARPELFVDYILVSNNAAANRANPITTADRARGFYLEESRVGWDIYVHEAAPPLLIEIRH